MNKRFFALLLGASFVISGLAQDASAVYVGRTSVTSQASSVTSFEPDSFSSDFAVFEFGWNRGDLGVETSSDSPTYLATDSIGESIWVVSTSEFERSDFDEKDLTQCCDFDVLPAGRSAYGQVAVWRERSDTVNVNYRSGSGFKTGGEVMAITMHEVIPGLNGTAEANTANSFAVFPDSDGYLSGYVRRYNTLDTNQNPISIVEDDFNGGIVDGVHYSYSDVTGTEGTYRLDLTAGGLVTNPTDNGVVVGSAAANSDKVVLTRANSDGTFSLITHDVNIDGDRHVDSGHQFVYVPLTSPDMTAVGRIVEDTVGTSFVDIGTGNFSVSKLGPGEWFLSVTGADDSDSTLIITGGGEGKSVDNFVAYEAGNHLGTDGWYVRSLDIVGNRSDFSGDQRVDGQDFLIWQRHVGLIDVAGKPDGDSNIDDDVDGEDLTIWGTEYGNGLRGLEFEDLNDGDEVFSFVVIPNGTPPFLVTTATTIPEPTAAVLVLIGAMGPLFVRKKSKID